MLAEAEYQRLFSLAPDSARAHQVMAESYRAQDRPAEAEAEWKEALEKQPGSVEVLVALGDLTRSKSRFEEALAYYTRAVAVAPRQYDALYGLGVVPFLPGAAGQGGRVVPGGASSGPALGARAPRPGDLPRSDREGRGGRGRVPGGGAPWSRKMRQAYYQLGRAYRSLGRNAEADAAMAKVQELLRDELASEEGPPPSDPP